VEDVKQLGEVIKQKDEEIQKLKEEGAKNKNGGELFKMAQDISQLGGIQLFLYFIAICLIAFACRKAGPV